MILKYHLNTGFVKRMLKWHFQYYFIKKGTPISCGVIITNKCNARCLMCNIWKNTEPSTYPLENQKEAIDVLSDIGCFYYSISGGEPTLVKDLVERLDYAAKKIPYVHLVTNGLTMRDELAKEIGRSGINEISISIDGGEKFHNHIRGLEYAHERAFNALDLISTYAPKVKVVVNSILTMYNVADIRNLNQDLARRNNVYHKLLPLSTHTVFNNKDMSPDIFAGFEKANISEMESFLKSCASNPLIANSRAFLYKAVQYFQGNDKLLSDQKKCIYPYHSIEIAPDGYAYPCFSGKDADKYRCVANAELRNYFRSDKYRNAQRKLESCPNCNGHMMLCYYEPRLNFPLHNLLYYSIKNRFAPAG